MANFKQMEKPSSVKLLIDEKDLQKLDEKRGLIPRTAYLRQLIKKDLGVI